VTFLKDGTYYIKKVYGAGSAKQFAKSHIGQHRLIIALDGKQLT
jgi:hypothetical protein